MATTTIPTEPRLSARITDQLTQIAQAAREAAANPDLTSGVHEMRKAARRVRAIAELVGEALSRREQRTVRDAIRHARHVLGPARDHAVAAHLLPQLVLDEPAREAARLALHAAAFDAPTAEVTREALGASADAVARQIEIVKTALPPTLSFAMLAGGVKSVYARARRARTGAKRSKRAFHAWRRRSKELGYQLEVLGDMAGERLSELRHAIDEIAQAQRDAVDLLMLRGFVRSYRDLVDEDAIALLTQALDAQLRPLLKDVRRAGKAAFRQRPRALAPA
jgi:CHAD domain-containing protein